jgi:hypothetical protein
MIQERIGRKMICECQLLNDDKASRRIGFEGVIGLNFEEDKKK